eukprot:4953556-Amphidinium_carterae.1
METQGHPDKLSCSCGQSEDHYTGGEAGIASYLPAGSENPNPSHSNDDIIFFRPPPCGYTFRQSALLEISMWNSKKVETRTGGHFSNPSSCMSWTYQVRYIIKGFLRYVLDIPSTMHDQSGIFNALDRFIDGTGWAATLSYDIGKTTWDGLPPYPMILE